MKQGMATSSKMGSTKVEPNATAVSPMKAGMPGIAKVFAGKGSGPNQSAGSTLGVKAPPMKCTEHKSGSQGRH